MGLVKAYKLKREAAKKAFDELTFVADNGKANLDSIYRTAIRRYDAEIDWYDRHADRRRIWSGMVRFLAVLLGTLSLVFINTQAFSSERVWALGVEVTVLATSIAIIAGGILLLDTVFQITTRYGRWRVAEYTIRVMRTEFEVEFLNSYGAIADDMVTETTFNKARVMAKEKFKAVEEQIKAEVESWQASLDKAMETLRQKIDKTTEEVKQAASKAANAADERRKQDDAEQSKTKPVTLDVTVAKEQGRPANLSVVVFDDAERQVKRNDGLSPGRTAAFLLRPDPYIVRLFGPDNKEIASKSKRLLPTKDDTLNI